ncbi:MAG TPA: sugar phosphate isomerase/epimerase [archaeon]|nr:sugar phosphate isomerase/epimerase [archaeon]
MKLCFNTIACRNAKEPLTEIIGQISGIGSYSAVELWIPNIDVMDERKARELASFCADRGLDLPIVTGLLGVLNLQMTNLDEQLELCRKLSRLAGWLGARLVRSFVGWVGEVSSRNPDPEYYSFLVGAYKNYCKILADSGLTVVHETHQDTYVDTAKGALKFLNDVGEPNQGFILQLGIVPRWSGMDGVEFYRALEKHVKHMHFHPYPWREHEDNLPNYLKLLPVLEQENPDFYISVENCEGEPAPLEAARHAAELIRKLSAGEKVEPPDSA